MPLLVGGIPTPLKRMKVSWGYYSQYMEKQKMFQTTNQITLMKMSELIGIDLLIQLHKNWGLYLVSNSYNHMALNMGDE